jgi:hypothetical protein
VTLGRKKHPETTVCPPIPFSRTKQTPPAKRKKTVCLSHREVIQPGRVIIKLKSRPNRVEFLTADNPSLSFVGREQAERAEMTGIN